MDRPTPEGIRPALDAAAVRSIIIGILIALLLAALDQTIVATALPTIGRELGDVANMPWVVTAYLLAGTAVTPLYGKVSDIYGRRITLLFGIATFILGSIACALAPTMLALILARALQGLGGGGLISLAQTIIADIVAPRERARYQVYIAGVFVTASLLGPVLGGVLAEKLHWSAIFWINLPLGLVAYAMSNGALKRLPRHERPHRLDLIGATLAVCATVSVLMALSWGGLRYPWLSPQILGLLAASASLWALFAWRLQRAPEPFIPLAVLRNPVVRAGTLSACFGMGTYIGLTIFVPVFFESVLGLSAADSGLALIPLMVGTVTGATLSGRAMARVRHYKRLPIAGLVVAVLATGALAALCDRLPLWTIEVLLGTISLGLGTLLPVCTVSIQNAVEPWQLGTTTGVANFFRQLGGAFVVAIFGAIVLGGTAPVDSGVTLETIAGAAGRAAAAQVWGRVFAAATVGFLLALVCLVLMEERPLRSSVDDGDPNSAA